MVVVGAVDVRNSRSPAGDMISHGLPFISVSAVATAGGRAGRHHCLLRARVPHLPHGQVDVMGLHLAGHTHGVDMTMKRRLGAPSRPGLRAHRARTLASCAFHPLASTSPFGDGAGWAELPNPVVTVAAVPGPLARQFPAGPSLLGATRPAVVPLLPAQGGHRMLALGSTPGRGGGWHVRGPGWPGSGTVWPRRCVRPCGAGARSAGGGFQGLGGSDHRLGAWAATSGRSCSQPVITGLVITGPGRGRPHPAGRAPNR